MGNLQQDNEQNINFFRRIAGNMVHGGRDTFYKVIRHTKAAAAVCKDKVTPAVRTLRHKAGVVAARCGHKAHLAAAMSWDATQLTALRCKELARKEWKRAGVVASKVRVRVDRHPVSPLLYIALLCVGVGALAFNGMYTKAYVAYVDGQEVGVVSSQDEIEDIVGNVETRAASVLGEEYNYNAEITLTPAFLDANSRPNAQAVEDALFENTGALMPAYAISVDGQELGYAQTSQELQGMLDVVAQPYLSDNTTQHRFTQDVKIFPVELPSNTQFDPVALQTTLSSNKEEAQYVTVARKDTFNSIAQAAGLTGDQLKELNPDVKTNRLKVGDQLLVKRAVPLLTVETVAIETYEETTDSPVEYIDKADLYEGTTQVKEEGQSGVEQIQATVTYADGVEIKREELSRTVIQPATTTYLYKGTKKKPASASTGQFIWPLRGSITSHFGYRDIFGGTSHHSGLDIAAPNGSQIVAADGGTVTFAGWFSTYGQVVIITHDNGLQTYYAHCSSLLVNTGDRVYQGQPVGRVGMTGSATGYHCHFEVRKNGQSVDPEQYL